MRGRIAWFALLASCLVASPAQALSLIVDGLGTPDVVQAGDSVSFSFALRFDPELALLATQAEISAPQLTGFSFEGSDGIAGYNPWDLSSTFRRMGAARDGNPMWVHAENFLGEDPPGVTWDEVGGIAPLGTFSAVAAYNGEIEFLLSRWELLRFDGIGPYGAEYSELPIDPAWLHIRTGVTVVGGLDLPLPLPPADSPPETQPPATSPPGDGSIPQSRGGANSLPEPPLAAPAALAALLVAARQCRSRSRRGEQAERGRRG